MPVIYSTRREATLAPLGRSDYTQGREMAASAPLNGAQQARLFFYLVRCPTDTNTHQLSLFRSRHVASYRIESNNLTSLVLSL